MRILVSALVLMFATSALAAADTLVVKGADGKFQPGAAKSWKGAGTSVTFQLAAGVDGNAVAEALSSRLASAKVAFANGELSITGVPLDALLDQLSALSLTGEGDPLAGLAGMGGATVAMEAPEGGGSIRASKPSGNSVVNSIKDHDPQERFEADVVEVKRGGFPEVVLKLKLRKVAKAGPLKKKLHAGQLVEATVVFQGNPGSVNLYDANNQRNLAAFYLTAGDHVTVHAMASDSDALTLDWVTRK